MIKAILFDLDNTLLENDMGIFIPSFLEALAPRFAHLMPPETFKGWMLRSVRQMIVDLHPGDLNRDVFTRDLVMRSGYSWKVLGPIFDAFYAEDYAGLKDLSRPIALAPRVVRAAVDLGLVVAIATNPVFPLAAIEERIRWAMLNGCPFAAVTSWDDMHFCKPHPEYFTEVVKRLGERPEECLMAGDDLANDLPAAEAGLKTFLVTDHTDRSKRSPYEPTLEGSLADLHDLLSSGRLAEL